MLNSGATGEKGFILLMCSQHRLQSGLEACSWWTESLFMILLYSGTSKI